MFDCLKKIFVLSALCISFNVQAEIVRRAAFDFGSGKIKLQVADVDTELNAIVQTIHSEYQYLQLSDDAAHQPNGEFSQTIQDTAIKITRDLKQKALALGAVAFRGLATEAYRKSPSGPELVQKYQLELGIPVTIIAQTEEGKNGFLAVIAEQSLDPHKVVTWDIGGGSFQVTYLDDKGDMQVYMGPYGRITTKNAIIQNIKKDDPAIINSPNPMNQTEWENSLTYFCKILPDPDTYLLEKLRASDVFLIGISSHPMTLRFLGVYHASNILDLLEQRLNKNDQMLSILHNSPSSAVSELVLVYSIMQKLGVEQVRYVQTQGGSTSALLISEDYWTLD